MDDQPDELRPILDQLLRLRQAAHELGEHEVGYHALAAAAHAAEGLRDPEMLSRIAQLSRDELERLSRNEPEHRMVTGTFTRNHASMFEQLAVTAGAMRQRIESERVLAAARERISTHPPAR